MRPALVDAQAEDHGSVDEPCRFRVREQDALVLPFNRHLVRLEVEDESVDDGFGECLLADPERVELRPELGQRPADLCFVRRQRVRDCPSVGG